MRGRAEIARLKSRLDNAFDRYALVGDDLEVKADFARYLCVLLSGYLEQAVSEMALEYCRLRSERAVQSYVSSQLNIGFRNANTDKIFALLAQFDLKWNDEAQNFIVDDKKAAVNSVVGLRHGIAHGENVGITFVTLKQYYERIETVIQYLADLILPLPPAPP